MANKEVKGVTQDDLKFDLDTLDNRNKMCYLLSFMKNYLKISERYNFDYTNTTQAYNVLLKHIPDGIEAPSLAEWLYVYNMTMRQRMVDNIFRAYSDTCTAITEAKANDDESTLKFQLNHQKELERRYNDMSRDLLKYVNDTLNRESRDKNADKAIRMLTPSDLHRIVINQD